MLHPIGDYRNCPSNNIFIASGWLNATLEILLPSLHTPASPTTLHSAYHPALHPHANRLSNNYRKYTVEQLTFLSLSPSSLFHSVSFSSPTLFFCNSVGFGESVEIKKRRREIEMKNEWRKRNGRGKVL